MPKGSEQDTVIAAVGAGDESAFAVLVARHRRELHVHCYRMLGSFEEAEDLVQETFLRAWHKRASFDGSSLLRAWLYRIATNACLDKIRHSKRQVASLGSGAEIPWLTPYPDRLLDEAAPSDDQPDAVLVAKETIELAFLAAIQLLPATQRAALILRDVLGWSAGEAAGLLEITVASANSLLQRARATLRQQLPSHGGDWSPSTPTAEEMTLLQGFIDSHERSDVAAAVALMRNDIRVTMPPYPWCFEGIEAVTDLFTGGTGKNGPGDWKLVATRANHQPTAASYLRVWGDTEFRAFKFDVLRVEDGAIAEITTFGPELFPAFGLPATL